MAVFICLIKFFNDYVGEFKNDRIHGQEINLLMVMSILATLFQ